MRRRCRWCARGCLSGCPHQLSEVNVMAMLEVAVVVPRVTSRCRSSRHRHGSWTFSPVPASTTATSMPAVTTPTVRDFAGVLRPLQKLIAGRSLHPCCRSTFSGMLCRTLGRHHQHHRRGTLDDSRHCECGGKGWMLADGGCVGMHGAVAEATVSNMRSVHQLHQPDLVLTSRVTPCGERGRRSNQRRTAAVAHSAPP